MSAVLVGDLLTISNGCRVWIVGDRIGIYNNNGQPSALSVSITDKIRIHKHTDSLSEAHKWLFPLETDDDT